MSKKRFYKPEEIIGKLREAEVLLSKGMTAGEACRKIGVTENTYYKWRKKCGGMRINRAKGLKELEKENARLLPQNILHEVDALISASREQDEDQTMKLLREIVDSTVEAVTQPDPGE